MEPALKTIHEHDPQTGFLYEQLRVGNPDGSFAGVLTKAYDTNIGKLLGTDNRISGNQYVIDISFNSHTIQALRGSGKLPSNMVDSPLSRSLYLTSHYTAELGENLYGLGKILAEHPELSLGNASYIVMNTELIEAMLAVNNLGFHFIENKYDFEQFQRQYGNRNDQTVDLSQIGYLPGYMEGRYCHHIGLSRRDLLFNGSRYMNLANLGQVSENSSSVTA